MDDDVTTVVVYATAPYRGSSECSSSSGQWAGRQIDCGVRCEVLAVGTNRAGYEEYYAGHDRAVGPMVGSATRYPHRSPVAALVPQPHIPMSFVYLAVTVLHQQSICNHQKRPTEIDRSGLGPEQWAE